MNRFKLLIIVILSLCIVLSGCSENKGGRADQEARSTDVTGIGNTDGQSGPGFFARIDGISSGFGKDDEFANELMKQLDDASNEEKAEILMGLADDMTYAQTAGFLTDDMMITAGQAVKAYPHPLLLNNYSSMLYAKGYMEDALYFYRVALEQEPENAVILTNIANIYIELDDFNSAMNYAKRAISATPDFGPAYQAMTTIHLKNDNSILAAETMVKSAKNCFNDLTINHFDSFLSAVDELDPERDEYPLKEEYLTELYKMAAENVDIVKTNGGVDTPQSQVTLQAFPPVSDADSLIKAGRSLVTEMNKLENRMLELSAEPMPDPKPDLNMEFNGKSASFPVNKNLRQIYALKVLDSFYRFKMQQIDQKYESEISKLREELYTQSGEVYEKYDKKIGELTDKISSGEFIGAALDSIEEEDDSSFIGESKSMMKAAVEIGKLNVEKCTQVFNLDNRFYGQILPQMRDKYSEEKQVVEEYWLKMGGLLKYVTDPYEFNYWNRNREQYILEWSDNYLSLLSSNSEELRFHKMDIKNEEYILAQTQAAGSQSEAAMPPPEVSDSGGTGLEGPEMEEQAISKFPERSDMGSLSAEFGFFGYNASAEFDGETLKVGYDTPSTRKEWSYNTLDGSRGTCTAYGVKAEANTEWFTNKAIQKGLKASGKLGKFANSLGKIGFGFSNGTKEGDYTVMSASGEVIERGRIRIRESSGSVGDFGAGRKVEVKKPLMTGIATISKSTKYSFKFVSYESN